MHASALGTLQVHSEFLEENDSRSDDGRVHQAYYGKHASEIAATYNLQLRLLRRELVPRCTGSHSVLCVPRRDGNPLKFFLDCLCMIVPCLRKCSTSKLVTVTHTEERLDVAGQLRVAIGRLIRWIF